MRWGWIIVAVGLISGGVLAYSPARVGAFAEFTKKALQDFAFQRDIRVHGANVLNASEVQALLPNDSNNFWWTLNTRVIEAAAVKSPLVAQATVSRCHWYSFKCFSIDIAERKPGFLAVVGDTRWIVATDGTYISPIPKKQQYRDDIFSDLPVVKGLVEETGSPELFKARFRFMKELLDLINTELGLKVREVEIARRAEMDLLFQGLDFRARFDSSIDNIGRVREEILRLKRLLVELKGREHLIQEVDLAFNKVAIVKLKKGEAS